MTRMLLTIPFLFAGEAIPGVGDSVGGLGGLVLQFGAFGVVCWLAYYLVTKRMPEIEQRHADERAAAEIRRQERDKLAAEERERAREMFQAALEKVSESAEKQCKFRERQ